MTHDWILVETLGAEPAVVAQGQSTKNLVPISAYLRRHPHLMAIQTAIGETVRTGQPLSSITPKNDRVIRTEVVQMTDGRIHGVHVWIGPPDEDPPDRMMPGPQKWDLTHGIATDTVESLSNAGRNPSESTTQGRPFADDLPTRGLFPEEEEVLSVAIKPEPGRSFCSTWNVTDFRGRPITVGFVARMLTEPDDDGGRDILVCRAMNWRSVSDESTFTPSDLERLPIAGDPTPGVHRALVDLRTWRLLKWLDAPAPFYDWHFNEGGESFTHPADADVMASMTADFEVGPDASRVLRLRAHGGGWIPVHVTVHLIAVGDGAPVAQLSLRLPTDDELESAAAPPKGRKRKKGCKGRRQASDVAAP